MVRSKKRAVEKEFWEVQRREVESRAVSVSGFQKRLRSMHLTVKESSPERSRNARSYWKGGGVSLVRNLGSLERFRKVSKARAYWNGGGMSVERKLGLLRLRVEELESFFRSLKDDDGTAAMEVLFEAIGFARDSKSWKFWECCCCSEKFFDWGSYENHLVARHRLEKTDHDYLARFLPDPVDGDSVEEIVNGEWKPVDSDAAIKIILNQTGCSCSCSCSCDPTYGIQPLLGNWPLCNDPERTAILGTIRGAFQLLLRHQCLTQSHIQRVIQYTLDELQDRIQVEHLRLQGLLKLKVICLSTATQLNNILSFLNSLVDIFGFSEDPPHQQPSGDGDQEFQIKERVVFAENDLSCLLMDKRLLLGELSLDNYSNAVAYDGSAGDSGMGEVDVLPKDEDVVDEIVPWLYAGPTVGEALKLWRRFRNRQKAEAQNIYEIYRFESLLLRYNCERKSRCLKSIRRIGEQLEEWESYGESFVARMLFFISKLRTQKQQLPKNLPCYDALITRRHSLLPKYKLQIWQASAYDYRSILLPLLKSFMLSRLEDLIEKDVMEKGQEY